MEVVSTALISNALECPDPNSVVKRNRNGSFFAGLRMFVFQNRVIASCSVMLVTKFL